MYARFSLVASLLVLFSFGCSSGDDPPRSSDAGSTASAGAGHAGTFASGGRPAGGSGGTPSAGGASSGSGPVAGSSSGTTAGGSTSVGGSLGAGGSPVGAGGRPDAGGANGGSQAGGAPNGGSGASGDAGSGASAGAGASMGGQSSGGAGAGGGSGSTGSPGVRVVGRTAAGNGGSVKFSWPGVTINARFTGTQVSMNLKDGNNKNRFTVVVDGGTPKTVTTTSAETLSLATGLTNGTHDLVIWRNTEASPGGITEFIGLSDFGSGGALQPPAAAPERRIEVIGDSLSVGAGDEGTSTSCSPSIDAFTNNYLAYGSVAARSVQADVATIAWSGIGVYRSYSASDPTMPQRYDYAIANDMTAWDFSKYQPHVVVINLGTNDFSNNMNPGQPYVDAYVTFIKHVRSKYANAKFILIDMYGGDRQTAINSVVTTLKSGGENQVEMLSFSAVPNNNTACNSHPNVAAQKAMGDILAARLKTLMSW